MLSAENSEYFSMLKGEGLMNDEGCVGLKKKDTKKKTNAVGAELTFSFFFLAFFL